MGKSNLLYKKQHGQTLVLSVVFLSILSSLLVSFFQVSLAVNEKIRLQIAADAAVLSALNCEANALNTIALTNRAILANDALAAQLNAFISESSFYRKLADKFSKLLQLIPYAGPISRFVTKGIETLEILIRRISSIILPLINLPNKSLSLTQTGIRQFFPYHTIKALQGSLALNMPQAELTQFSKAMLIQQTRNLQHSLGDLNKQEVDRIRLETMDKHTKKRNWKISVASISPVKKAGGTKLKDGEPIAQDKLKLKVFSKLQWRWKTVLSSKSRTDDFKYRSPRRMITLLEKGHSPSLSLGISVQSVLPDFPIWIHLKEKKLTATSAGTLYYRRESRPGEIPNTFNPYWRVTLIPVATESTFKRTIPAFILKETRH